MTGRPTCVIDGRPAPLIDWQADVEADWGDRTLTGRLPRFTPWAAQGAPIKLWRSTGDLMWSGELTQDPKKEGDTWTVRAHGGAEVLAENRTRMFYRIDGSDGFVSAESDPHNIDLLSHALIDERTKRGRISFITTPDKAYAVGDITAVVLWVEGGPITRVSYVITKSGNQSNMDIRTSQRTGPTGSATIVDELTMGSGTVSGSTHAFDMASPEDLIQFGLRAIGTFTPSIKQRFSLTQIKVYGRTADDAFSASDVAADVGGLSGLDTGGVRSNGLQILPLDWTDDHPALLDYMAQLTDWRWLVRGGALEFGPWERTWRAFTNRDASASLEPEPRYNRFPVRFEALSGVHREVVGEPSVDPFPGEEVVAPGVDLEHPQPDALLATAVAAAGAEHAAARNLNGSVELARVRDDRGGVHSPHAACAGDLLLMPDLHPVPVQRIQSITYRPDDQATAEVGETFNPIHVIAGVRREKKRPKRRRRRRAA